MNRQGILIVVSGFSGAGKGTIMKALTERYEGYALSVSATTRSPRPGEEDGKAYFFKSVEEFEQMIADGALIEYARYVSNYYGTPRKFVEESLDQGKNIILEIEVMGAMKIKEQYPDALLIFISAPSIDSLRDRLRGRGTEAEDVILKRLKKATEESADMDKYDYIVINDDLEECIQTVNSVIVGYACRTSNNKAYIKEIRDDLKGIW